MLTWQDAVGNVHGRVEGPDPDMPALLIGWAVMHVSIGALTYIRASVHAADHSILTSSMKTELTKTNFSVLEDTFTSCSPKSLLVEGLSLKVGVHRISNFLSSPGCLP